ncbi:MFS transporter [soil metagenome]
MKAAAIAGGGKALLLGELAAFGAIVAAVANLVFGALSDATRSRLGRRRPWLIAGWLLSCVALWLFFRAQDRLAMFGAVLVFQLAVNATYAPLVALLPDLTPDDQKGAAAAWTGLAMPISNLFTAVVVGALLATNASRYLAVAIGSGLLIIPFALALREPSAAKPTRSPARFTLRLEALGDHNFRVACVSRLLIETTIALNTLFLLYYLQERSNLRAALPGMRPEAALGVLLIAGTLSMMVSGFVSGLVSDRSGRRRPMVLAGCLFMVLGTGFLVLAPHWPGPLVAQVLFGLGHGIYSTNNFALVAEILPDRERSGRDLGLMNIAVALAQALGPAIGVGLAHAGYRLDALFTASLLMACFGGASLLLLKLPTSDQIRANRQF